jgi:predicted transposase/invertase (TIGR01784 family)
VTTEKYINPFTDFGFKKLFGEEPNKELLVSFLNQLLPQKHQVADLSFTKTEQLGNTPIDRKAIFDLYCVSPSGERFIVELQKANGATFRQNFFRDRSVYYASFPIQEQGIVGSTWNYKLAPVYTVGILDFLFDDEKNDQSVIHTVQLKDQDCRVFYEKLTFIYLSMPNFNKREEELETLLDKWLFVFKQLPMLQARPARLQERVFDRLFQVAEVARYSREEQEAYVQSRKYYWDLNNVIDTANLEGIETGREAGREEGREQTQIDIILTGHQEGFSPEQLSKLTKLPLDQVLAIIAEDI